MKNEQLNSAIARSISHTEIARIECMDVEATYAEILGNDEVENLDRALENNGNIDVWGTRNGEYFRLRLVKI